MINLEGKVALITGASGAIGSSTSKMLHKFGAHVVISGTNVEKLEKLGQELRDNFTIKPCNLNDKKACAKLVEEIENLDILVCNAGITRDMLAIRMALESFEEVVNINLTSNFILNQSALKKMIKNKVSGRIINISSIVGVSGNPGQANYCAAKAGLIGMTKSLAMEVASRGITVNCVAPGFIKSDMTDGLTESQKESILQRVPMKRMGEAEDIASTIAFLSSNYSSYITGQTIHVNGGMLMV